MPYSIDNINSGEILLKEICDFFNDEKGYGRIKDILNIKPETKQELLYFINKKCKNEVDKCNFGIRALNRLIEQVDNKELLGLIRKNPIFCTLCFLPLKRINPSLKFRSQKNNKKIGNETIEIVYGVELYVERFNKEFIEPLILADPIISSTPEIFNNSTWYLFKNLKDAQTSIRKTERNILKFLKEDDIVKVEYYSTNDTNPDWTGFAKYQSVKKQLLLNLSTEKNKLRDMRMKFEIHYLDGLQFIEGSMTFTKMREIDKLVKIPVFIREINYNMDISLKVLSEGEDKSIQIIEEKLKKANCKIITITPSVPCHDEE